MNNLIRNSSICALVLSLGTIGCNDFSDTTLPNNNSAQCYRYLEDEKKDHQEILCIKGTTEKDGYLEGTIKKIGLIDENYLKELSTGTTTSLLTFDLKPGQEKKTDPEKDLLIVFIPTDSSLPERLLFFDHDSTPPPTVLLGYVKKGDKIQIPTLKGEGYDSINGPTRGQKFRVLNHIDTYETKDIMKLPNPKSQEEKTTQNRNQNNTEYKI